MHFTRYDRGHRSKKHTESLCRLVPAEIISDLAPVCISPGSQVGIRGLKEEKKVSSVASSQGSARSRNQERVQWHPGRARAPEMALLICVADGHGDYG